MSQPREVYCKHVLLHMLDLGLVKYTNIKILNKRGPRMPNCRTPAFISNGKDMPEPVPNNCVVCLGRNLINHEQCS